MPSAAPEAARIPPRIIDLLITCLAIDSAQRPESAAAFVAELDASMSPRFRMATFQWAAEVLMVRNRPDLALEAVCWAATRILLDLFWLEKCPLLAPLRPDYADLESLRITRERAAAITPF